MITVQELLYNRGLDRNAKIKLVRHKEKGKDLFDLYRRNYKGFLEYQKRQRHDVFRNVDYIVSFIGEEGVTARFVGVYKVLGKAKNDEGLWVYSMTEVDGYEDLKERIIIRWENAISWHQWMKQDMEVLEISPGLHYKQFTDYMDVVLDFQELKEIVTNQYKDWRSMLSATKGIYLITDKNTGKLYVGSAYGEDGIWGRWSSYVSTGGHGGNKALVELIKSDSNYAERNFQFSILMLLPKTVTAEEAIRKEQLFKKKLGTNSVAFGLNKN